MLIWKTERLLLLSNQNKCMNSVNPSLGAAILGSIETLHIEWTQPLQAHVEAKQKGVWQYFFTAGTREQHWHAGRSSLAPPWAVLWCTECVGSLIVSLSWHFNGRATLVSGLAISMVKLFPLRGYFHWPDRIFPFTPQICVTKQPAVFFHDILYGAGWYTEWEGPTLEVFLFIYLFLKRSRSKIDCFNSCIV